MGSFLETALSVPQDEGADAIPVSLLAPLPSQTSRVRDFPPPKLRGVAPCTLEVPPVMLLVLDPGSECLSLGPIPEDGPGPG